MTTPKLPVTLILGLINLLGLLIMCNVPVELAPYLGTIAVAFTSALVGLAGVHGTREAINGLANGSGVHGAIAALMTDAKPGETPEVKQ